MRIGAFLFLFLVNIASSPAAECTVKSGSATAALVELYTSEGCSSCPPADRWLTAIGSTTGDRPLVPRSGTNGLSFVPIAFHVAYWDYLGWKDAFADMRFTERQRQFARAAGASSVYTPQVVLGGRDFPEWRSAGSVSRTMETINARPSRAMLEIVTRGTPNARVSAVLAPGVRTDDLALFVAITQDGLSTKVKAGENRGETLRHDHVVRDLAMARDWLKGASASLTTTAEFAPRPDWKTDRMNVVAFVQNLKSGEVLQALSAPLCVR